MTINADYWVVFVTDPSDPELAERRFTFPTDGDPEEAASKAWSCYARAMNAGFKARAEHVRSAEMVSA